MLATLLARAITWQPSPAARSPPTIGSALVMNFGIQTLGWYLGAMAVIALVALVLFRESKDMDFKQACPAFAILRASPP